MEGLADGMDLDIADEAPSASTSGQPMQQQEHNGAATPAVGTSKTSPGKLAGVLLFPFEAEGDLSPTL